MQTETYMGIEYLYNPDKTIEKFDGTDFSFLSNFYNCSIRYGAHLFPSSEHLYMWHKTDNMDEKNAILRAERPAQAKKLGRKVTLREDWDEIKDKIMMMCVAEKFRQNRDLAHCLIQDTGYAYLIEGNNWGDRYWGMVDGVGKNKLGKTLMVVRERARSGIL
jgi:ribA/ribD-fused uncharacterized protein